MLKKLRKNDYTCSLTYRSITLLNTLEKVLKVVISNRIRFIVKANNLLLDT